MVTSGKSRGAGRKDGEKSGFSAALFGQKGSEQKYDSFPKSVSGMRNEFNYQYSGKILNGFETLNIIEFQDKSYRRARVLRGKRAMSPPHLQ